MSQYDLLYTFADGFISEESIEAETYIEAVKQLRSNHDENIVKIVLICKLPLTVN